MSPSKLGPRSSTPLRRVRPLHSVAAYLPRHRLVFDVPGLPPEPAFANLAPDPASTVHGVLHYLAPADFARVTLSEGIPPEATPLAALPIPRFGAARHVTVVHDTLDGPARVLARAFFFQPPLPIVAPLRRVLRPSRRYVQLALDGAEYWRLPAGYVDQVLRQISVDQGPLAAFSMLVEPRPHLLDRPDPDATFGKASTEMYSPWQPIRAKEAVRSFEDDEAFYVEGTELRLVHLSNVSEERRQSLRKMYYIPGIDGTGKSILSQMDALDKDGEYDVSSIVYPFKNRQSLAQVANSIIELVLEDAHGRSVSFIGESMGGVFTVLLAKENIKRKRAGRKHLDIDLLMMINPATCYERSSPRELWNFLLSLKLGNALYAALLPPVLLPFVIDIDSVRQSFGPSLAPRLRNILKSLPTIADVLPQDALSYRLRLLTEFSMSGQQLAELGGSDGPSNIAVISSINDNLIPSLSENYRLQRHIPGIYSAILPYGGHVPSFDARFSLAGFLKPFRAKDSNDSHSNSVPVEIRASLLRRREALRNRFARKENDGNNLARNSYTDVQDVRDWLSEWTRWSSPVFVGEENLPSAVEGKPVLLVCNHTTLGWLDGMYPSERILSSKGVLVRPLSHPSLFKREAIRFPGVPSASTVDMEKFGLVTVSPAALAEQLANGHWSMLFPGAAAEALKGPNDKKYSLRWPESPEFVRACALFGATIVPVSTVGAEDMVNIILDSKTVASLIDTGGKLFGRPDLLNEAFVDDAKAWKQNGEGDTAFLVPPLGLPAGADRLYFRFGKPIEVPAHCVDNPVAAKDLYINVKSAVEDGIDILLRRREFDDFRAFSKRDEFAKNVGENVEAPAGPAWVWTKGVGAYLDHEVQPPV